MLRLSSSSALFALLLLSNAHNHDIVGVSATLQGTVSSNGQVNVGVGDAAASTSRKPSRVMVHIPMTLHNPDGEEHNVASYGLPKYNTYNNKQHIKGGTILRYVYLTNSFLCNPMHYNSQTTLYPHGDKDHKNTMNQNTPFILMTIDGAGGPNSALANTNDTSLENEIFDCSYVTKARNAQEFGASALVIGWDKEDEPDVDPDDPDNGGGDGGNKTHPPSLVSAVLKDDAALPHLVDDGSGLDISIPSFVIGKTLTHQIKQTLKEKNQPVLMELTWGLPPGTGWEDGDELPESKTNFRYDMWLSASNHDPFMTPLVYEELQTINEEFNDIKHPKKHNVQIEFQPRYSIIDGRQFNCAKEEDEVGACDHMCTNYGRYCAIPDGSISGKEIVTETFRRLCIYQHYGNSQWFDYILHHHKDCSDPDQYGSEECIQKAMKNAKIKQDDIDGCFTDSGGLDADRLNSLLQDQIDTQKERSATHVASLPAITVMHNKGEDPKLAKEGSLIKQPFAYNLFQAICNHYWYLSDTYNAEKFEVPNICIDCQNCPNVVGCLDHGGNCKPFDKNRAKFKGGEHHHHHHHHAARAWLITLSVLGVVGGGVYYYMTKVRGGGGDMQFYPHGGGMGGGGNFGGASPDDGSRGLLTRYFQLPQGEGTPNS